jgi:hypothetical protein
MHKVADLARNGCAPLPTKSLLCGGYVACSLVSSCSSTGYDELENLLFNQSMLPTSADGPLGLSADLTTKRVNSSKADADEATLSERVKLATV